MVTKKNDSSKKNKGGTNHMFPQNVGDAFEEGLGFDGSSIRGWQSIHASDMLVIPDPKTARIDPFTAVPTLSIICDVVDPITREPYSRDPRNIAKKAIAH